MAANSCTRFTIVFTSVVLAILFLAITGLGIAGVVTMKGLSGPIIGVIVVGAVGVLFSIFGILGGQFDVNQKPKFTCCLILFYIFMIVFTIVFVIGGAACFCLEPSMETILFSAADTLKNILKLLGLETVSQLVDKLKTIKTLLTVVGVIFIVTAVVGGIAVIAGSIHMGRQNFQKFYMVTGSILMLIIAVILIIMGIALLTGYNNVKDIPHAKAVTVSILVTGSVMALIALFGIGVSFCTNKNRLFLCIFIIATLVITLAFVAILIVAIVLRFLPQIYDTYCKDNADRCANITENYREAKCSNYTEPADKQKCKDAIGEDAIKKLFTDTYISLLSLAIVVCCIIIVVLVFILIASCMSCRRAEEDPNTRIAREMPNYRSQKDVAY